MAGIPHPAPLSMTLAMTGTPRIGIEGRTVLSGLGRTAALFFLVQGNLPLAALSLIAGLCGRLSPEGAAQAVSGLRERLLLEGQQVRDELIRRRHDLADAWQKELGKPFTRVFDLLADLGKRASGMSESAGGSEARAMLEASSSRLKELRQGLDACRKRL